MLDFPTRVSLAISFRPNPLLNGSTDDGDPESVGNPNVDPHFATTWTILCFAHDRNDVGEITIELNRDNTIKKLYMWIQPNTVADKAQWYEFTATSGFTSSGDFSEFSVTGMSWVEGPDGAPPEAPPIVSTISGTPKVQLEKSPE
jgi:hypothetical protein